LLIITYFFKLITELIFRVKHEKSRSFQCADIHGPVKLSSERGQAVNQHVSDEVA